ncbi:restriction endonuclease-like protein [Methanobacterium paludis]|uniref:restriction endonuclease-like protein n=1 Tax=Methanobacterium paludis (strain DSM 25820 / JCM 18151 / SWAN1) TaxID=868131 RepID=UPI000A513D94|nr:restriction endonuclease-like protein [Methanobacterium paludis]
MVEQRVLINLQDKKGNELGLLTISAVKDNLNYQRSLKKGIMTFENIPLVEKPDDKTPIQYYSNKEVNGLSKLMLLEETKYQILFETKLQFKEEPNVFQTIQRSETKIFEELRFKIGSDESYRCAGILNFHSYVGKSFFDVEIDGVESVPCPFEVRSKKINYYEHYPAMIADLSEVASGIIYEMDSPLSQDLEFYRKPKETLYEDFMFLEYLFRLENLPTAYEYIKRNMYSLLESYVEVVPASFASNLGPSEMLDILSRPDNLFKTEDIPSDWPSSLNGYVPDTVTQRYYHETIDTPENRFLKYFLELLDKLIDDLIEKLLELRKGGYVLYELYKYQRIVQDYLSEKWVKNVGKLNYLPLNSQVIQKREGYRDIFKYYIQFEFSFRLQWEEVEDQIKGYERKLSELYEYWCYFKLVKVLNKLSNEKLVYNDIYNVSPDKWSIKVKRGQDSLQIFSMDFNGNKIKFDV